MKKTILSISMAVALAFSTVPMFGRSNNPPRDMNDAVRHALVMLPYYSIFDDLGFQVNGDVVTLAGDVTRPILKSDAEHAVKRIPGVAQVVNNIKVSDSEKEKAAGNLSGRPRRAQVKTD